jgi:putative membrane protein
MRRRQWRSAGDDGFDKTYLDQQRAAHQEAITLHRGYAENGDNPQLRSVAIGGLPMLERHLKSIERIGVH